MAVAGTFSLEQFWGIPWSQSTFSKEKLETIPHCGLMNKYKNMSKSHF